tara:strand:- start:150 stop:284 length:135 start_codon:yes stop_codon:yes gene_type:complete
MVDKLLILLEKSIECCSDKHGENRDDIFLSLHLLSKLKEEISKL